MRYRQSKVFLALEWYEPGHFIGVSRCACEKNWVIEKGPTSANELHSSLAQQSGKFKPHGIICQFLGNHHELAAAAMALRIPMDEMTFK